MNYLAHILLSGDEDLVMVGNFMGDGVKGSDLSHLSPPVQLGVRLHRAIDSFTDQHPMAKLGRDRLRGKCGKYAGVVLDMLYDHVLAANWSIYHNEPLGDYIQRKYSVLKRNQGVMPDRIQVMLPYMIAQDWLGSYAEVQGIARALSGVAKRSSAGSKISGAEVILLENEDAFRNEFDQLFSDVFDMSMTMLKDEDRR